MPSPVRGESNRHVYRSSTDGLLGHRARRRHSGLDPGRRLRLARQIVPVVVVVVIEGEGTGRLRVGDETLTVPRYGGVLVGPDQLRQVFNDTDAEVLWLIVAAPEELEFLPGAETKPDMSLIYPADPKQLPKELAGVEWPPKS